MRGCVDGVGRFTTGTVPDAVAMHITRRASIIDVFVDDDVVFVARAGDGEAGEVFGSSLGCRGHGVPSAFTDLVFEAVAGGGGVAELTGFAVAS